MTRSLQDWILQLPSVTKASHRFGGTEYQIHGLEFMHSHGHDFLDIRLSKEDQERVLQEGKAESHRFAPQAGWITFKIKSEDDIEAAKVIIRLAHNHAERMMPSLASRRAQRR